jgi:hypothetical protein
MWKIMKKKRFKRKGLKGKEGLWKNPTIKGGKFEEENVFNKGCKKKKGLWKDWIARRGGGGGGGGGNKKVILKKL